VSDQCKPCTLSGRPDECKAADCSYNDSWVVQDLRTRLQQAESDLQLARCNTLAVGQAIEDYRQSHNAMVERLQQAEKERSEWISRAMALLQYIPSNVKCGDIQAAAAQWNAMRDVVEKAKVLIQVDANAKAVGTVDMYAGVLAREGLRIALAALEGGGEDECDTDDDEPTHDCDAMGCSSLGHVGQPITHEAQAVRIDAIYAGLKGGGSRWELLDRTSPSGKALFRCLVCGRESYAPDKRCEAGCCEEGGGGDD